MMWADYVREREGKETLEIADSGFLTYVIRGRECYIQDAYVVPEKRRTGVASDLLHVLENVARTKGCIAITCSVKPSANKSTDSLKAIIAAGFSLIAAENDAVHLIKELDHGC